MTTPTTPGATAAPSAARPATGPGTAAPGASASLGFFRGLWILPRPDLAHRLRWFGVMGAVTLLLLAAFGCSGRQGVSSA